MQHLLTVVTHGRILQSARRLALVGLVLFGFEAQRAAAQYQGCMYIQQITLEACKTLETFFTETDGPGWFDARGWLRSNQPCDWFGITCASGAWPRSITRIELSGNNLSGSLPGELSRLSKLRVLSIDNRGAGIRYRKLSGNIPAVLGQLLNLEVLRLDDNEFTGTIPPELGKLSSLRTLGLSHNRLSGTVPNTLGNLGALTTLDLSDNQLEGTIPDAVGNLHALEYLSLAGNLLQGELPNTLGSLSSIMALDLSRNNLEGQLPNALTNLQQLIWLSVVDTDLEGPLPLAMAAFGASVNTCQMERTQLCLPSDAPYTALGAGAICGLHPAASCQVCEGAACAALEALYYATDGPEWIQSDGWLATRSACDWVGTQCDGDTLTHLALNANDLQGALPIELGTLSTLQSLSLAGNALHGEIPTELGSLSNLALLDLSRNMLSGQLPLSVATLGAGLPSCDLSGNAGLCIPDEAEYRALDASPICALPLVSPCTPDRLVAIEHFAAEVTYDFVVLRWQTDEVPPEAMFEVQQRQSDGVFVSIAEVEADGTAYAYTLRDLPAGTFTFRIKQRTQRGSVAYTEAVSVTLVPSGLTVGDTYPMPFTTRTTASFVSGTQQVVRVDLFDASGRLVRVLYESTPQAHQMVTLNIDGSSLGSGLYVLRFLAGGRVQATRTLIRVR